MGSGFLLLTVGQELPKGTPMKYFGQELNITTYNLARMNLMMHSVSYNNMVLNNADTLESDWSDGPDAKGIDNPRSFDAVVANPPYSAKWDNDETKIPTVILVLKKNRENKDILFIDAINDLEKNKNQNNLRDEDIDKIIKTYKERKDVEKYAYIYQEIGGSQYGRFHNRYYRSCSCCRCLCVLEEKPTD